MDLLRFAVVFIVLSIIGGLSDGSSFQAQMTGCLNGFLPGSNVEDMVTSPLPNWEITKFKQVCSNKKAFDVCMGALPKDDERPFEIIKEILQKKMDFLCGDASGYFIYHKACMTKYGVQAKVVKCSDVFSHRKTNCAAVAEFRDCVYNAANICGSKARKLVTTYMDFNVDVFTGAPNCPTLTSGAPSTHYTVLGLMLPAVALWLKAL